MFFVLISSIVLGLITTNKTVVFDPSHPLIILAVSAEDHGTPRLSSLAEVQIRITGVNRHAPVFKRTIYSVRVPEDAPLGQKLLQVSAYDPDAKSDAKVGSVKYSLSGDPDAVFQIDGHTGAIIVVKKLDRERTASYSLRVVAADHGKPPRNSSAEVIVDVVSAAFHTLPDQLGSLSALRLSNSNSKFQIPIPNSKFQFQIPVVFIFINFLFTFNFVNFNGIILDFFFRTTLTTMRRCGTRPSTNKCSVSPRQREVPFSKSKPSTWTPGRTPRHHTRF